MTRGGRVNFWRGAIPGVGVVVYARCTLSLQALALSVVWYFIVVSLLGLVKGPGWVGA